MPQEDQALRPSLRNSGFYSSLKGLEMAVPPKCVIRVPKASSRYVDKPLPSLPLNSRSLLKIQNRDHISARGSSTRRLSTSVVVEGKRNRRKSSSNFKQSNGRSRGVGSKQLVTNHVMDRGFESMDRNPLYRSKFMRFTESDEGLASRIQSHMYDLERSDSAFSVSSSSVYSEEDDLEDIIDSYNRGRILSSIEIPRISAAQRNLYLQPDRNSASACELGCLGRPAGLSLPFRSTSHGDPPIKAATLNDLIKEERERSETISSQNDRAYSEHENITITKNSDIMAEADYFEFPSWNDYDEIVRSMAAPELGLRPQKDEEPVRCMSRFSNRSSEAEVNSRVIPTARDSIVSHIRSIPNPFNSPNRPVMAFKEKATTSSIKVPSVEKVAHERRFYSGKHLLKSHFPFSPLRKKANLDDCQHPKGPNLVRRLSHAFSHRFSGSQKSPTISAKIISNYARDSEGPDTRMPMKPEAMGVMSPTSIFHKSTLQFRDALEKAKRTAKIRSKDEKKRDQLRRQIVFVGAAKQAPGVQWL